MASKYDAQASMALRLISAKGADCPVTRINRGTVDPVTQVATETPTSETFKAVGMPPGRSAEFHIGKLEGRNVIELHFAQKGRDMIPSPGDRASWGGLDWALIWSQTYAPDGQAAIYTKAYAQR